ncbi:hypothetical protein PCANC_14449 [Puccinia coronata f. sp. avenae]|uniref:Tr-type G domain-containing protein n=1 Tax=Puccinia coronata f. sp. avenae TaxID=200324 RepID=A0A2N5USE4_9BASI|nr:hypothetical protein PCANC_14449 [Puccinia coronata f. sp. avenae]
MKRTTTNTIRAMIHCTQRSRFSTGVRTEQEAGKKRLEKLQQQPYHYQQNTHYQHQQQYQQQQYQQQQYQQQQYQQQQYQQQQYQQQRYQQQDHQNHPSGYQTGHTNHQQAYQNHPQGYQAHPQAHTNQQHGYQRPHQGYQNPQQGYPNTQQGYNNSHQQSYQPHYNNQHPNHQSPRPNLQQSQHAQQFRTAENRPPPNNRFQDGSKPANNKFQSSSSSNPNSQQQQQYGGNLTNQQLLKKRKDEEKKFRRIGILPTHVKPKSKPTQVVISKLAQEKKLRKLQDAAKPKDDKMLSHQPDHRVQKAKRELAIPSAITVSQLAQLTHQKLYRLQSLMQSAGLLDTRPDRILSTDDTAYLVLESGFEPIVNDTLAYDIYPDPAPADRSQLPLRPPVVCIMGHVDHGKTTLLDSLRKSSVAAGEAGGITQHIGAFEVALHDLMADAPTGEGPQTITFLDTPGHAAFSAMRSRGAMTTDVAVLVVAGDDGVKPQTQEVIELVRQTDVGVVVAITKCDKPGIDLHRTRASIYDAGIHVEGLGGEVPCVEVSAVTGKGLAELAETILAVAEVRDLRAERDGVRFEGRVIESDVERGHGNVASVITLRGNLHVGLDIIAGRSYGRVRQLIAVSGEPVSEISPGRPVRVSGWKSLPEAGSLVLGVESEEEAKRAYENRMLRFEELGLAEQIEVVNEKRAQAREAFESNKAELEGMTRRERVAHVRERNQQAAAQAKVDSRNEEAAPGCLNVVVKADFTGTVEAVRTAIEGLGNADVKVKIVSCGVGNISESDARMAIAAGATLVGFNVKIDPMAFGPIESHKVPYTIESIIYRLVDRITNDLIQLLPKRFKERAIGEAKILQIFEVNTSSKSSSSAAKVKSKVAGCKVTNGEIKKTCSVKILRNKEIIWKGDIKDLKQGKKETSGVQKGQEFGISFREASSASADSALVPGAGANDESGAATGQVFDRFEVDDEIVALDLVPIERTLHDGL